MENYTFTEKTETNTTLDIHQLELQDFLENDLPIVVYLSILAIVGSVGNCHAFFVYLLRYNPSNHRIFVVSLAAIDFVACTFCIPFEIFDLRFKYTLTSSSTCKLFRFLNYAVSINSGLMLGLIAVERFRKACRPFLSQLPTKGAIIACILTTCITVVLSLPAFVFYGTAKKDIKGLDTYNCKALPKFKKKILFKLYSGFFLLLTTVLFVICIVMYSFVGKVLYKQMKFRMEAQQVSRGNTIKSQQPMVPHDVIEEESSSVGRKSVVLRSLSSISNSALNSISRRRDSTRRRKLGLDRTRKITLMFLVATGVSYIGYIPNIIMMMIQAADSRYYKTVVSVTLGGLTPFLVRGYFLNNVTNPIVYSFFDDRFRRECKSMYKKLKFW